MKNASLELSQFITCASLPELRFTPGLKLNMRIVSDLTRTHSVPKDKRLHYQRALSNGLNLLQGGLNPEMGRRAPHSPIYCPPPPAPSPPRSGRIAQLTSDIWAHGSVLND